METGIINLRRATIEDVDIILEIEKNLNGKTYNAWTDKNELVKEISGRFFYIIEQNNEIIGNISYEIKDNNHAYLSGLGIDKKSQGLGIGRKIITMVLEELKGVKEVSLVVHPDNIVAISLYKSFGFKQVGEKKENYYGNGEPRLKMVLKNK